ncbi:MAG: MFS transporter, partial [Anaerolineaceae bacterium]
MALTTTPNNENSQKKWFVMAAVAMGIFLATVDSSIVNIALPVLVKELDTTFTVIEWVVLIYLLTISILLLSVGRIADMVGKKPIYLAGFLVFTVGSFLCGLSNNVYALIGFRSLQAIGASFLMVLGTAIITETFPSTERGM